MMMRSGGASVDWESIAKGLCDNTVAFTMDASVPVNPKDNLLTDYTLMNGHVTIKDGVTTIGTGTCYNCGVQHVTVPSTVTTIGNNFCRNCSSLVSVVCYATTPPTLGQRCFLNSNAIEAIYVPDASVTTYKEASGWSTYATKILSINDMS